MGGGWAHPKFDRMVIEGRFEHNEIKVNQGQKKTKYKNKKSKLLINLLIFILQSQNFLSFLKYFYILSLKTLKFLKMK